MPPLLRVQFEKRADGTLIFRCIRRDGSVTWQKGDNRAAHFFVQHDLTHFVVESELQHRHGFYGMIADGWNLTDFAAPWPRGRIPADMDASEVVVGMIDRERASSTIWTADECNSSARLWYQNSGSTWPWIDLTDEQLTRIRARLADRLAEYAAVQAGGLLELEFRVPDPVSA
jgi:hypothetical protein